MATLLTHFKMDSETSGVVSDEVASNDLTINGTATIVSGRDNNALSIDTANSNYGSFTWPSGTTTSHTVSGWYKFDNFSVQQKLWSKRTTGGTLTDFQFTVTSSTQAYWFIVGGGGVNAGFTFPALSTDTWYFFTATYDGSDVSLYIDGSFISSTAYTGTIDNNSTTCRIGEDWVGTYGAFDVDDFRVYDSSLTTQEVSDLYGSYPAPDPVVHWKLDEASGTTADDAGTNNLDGTYVGSPTLGVSGTVGTAVTFNGSSQYATFPTNAIFETQDFTINVWFKTSTTGVAQTFFTYYPAGAHADGRGVIFRTDGSVIYSYFGYATGSWDNLVGTASVNLGSWNMATLVVSGGNITLYLNGALDDTKALANPISWANGVGNPSSKTALIGADIDATDNIDTHYNGSLDDVKYFSSGLSASQISTIYTEGLAESGLDYSAYISSLNPIAWWKLDETSGNADDEIAGLDLNVSNVTHSSTALFNKSTSAYTLNGTDSALNRLEDAFALVGDMSWYTWFNVDDLTSNRILLICGGSDEGSDTEANNFLYFLRLETNGSLVYTHEYGTGTNIPTITFDNFTAVVGTTYNIVITRDSIANEVNLYVNGALVDTKTYNANPTKIGSNNSYFKLGSSDSNPDFSGVIDDSAIFSKMLTAGEIRSLYLKAINNDASTYSGKITSLGPIRYWRLGETSGTVAVDETGNGNGVYVGSPTLGTSSLVPTSADNKSVTFSGTNYVDVATNGHTAISDNWSIVTSFRTGADITNPLSFLGLSSSDFLYTYSGKLQIYKSVWYWLGPVLSTNTTYHLVLAYESGVGVKTYLNGGYAGTTAIAITLDTVNIGAHGLAPATTAQWWLSEVDDTAIFNKTLTAAQALDLYTIATSYTLAVDSGSYALTGTDISDLDYATYLNTLGPSAWWKLDDNLPSVAASIYDNDFSTSGALNSSVYEEILAGSPTAITNTSDGSTHTISFDGSGAISYLVNRSYFGLVGDFDVQIDVNSLTRDAGAGASYFWLGIAELGSSTHLVRVGVYKDDGADNIYIRHGGTFIWPAWVGTNARLRIQRVGSTYNIYYEDGIGAGWTLAASPVISSNPVFLDLFAYHATTVSSASYSANIDNLIFNSGTTSHLLAKDEIAGGSRNGTYTNSPTLGADSLIASETSGKSVEFVRNDSNYIQLLSGSHLDTFWETGSSLSFWMVGDTAALAASSGKIFCKDDTSNTYTKGWAVSCSGAAIGLYIRSPNVSFSSWAATGLTLNTGNHIVITFDSSDVNNDPLIYVDGVSVPVTLAQRTTDTSYGSTSGFAAKIGENNNSDHTPSQFYDGKLDDVALFADILTPTEVSNLASKGGTLTGLTYEQMMTNLYPLAYYKLGESSAAIDASAMSSTFDSMPSEDYWIQQVADYAWWTKSMVATGGELVVDFDVNAQHANFYNSTAFYYLRGTQIFTGDFSVQIDVTSLTHGGVTAGSAISYISLDARTLSNDYKNGRTYFSIHSGGALGKGYNAYSGGGASSGRTNPTGRLKLERISGTLKGYYEDGIGNGFVEAWSSATTDAVYIDLEFRHGVSTSSTTNASQVKLDNLVVTGNSVGSAFAKDEISTRHLQYFNQPSLAQTSLVAATSDTSVSFTGASSQGTRGLEDLNLSITNTGKLGTTFWVETGADVTSKQPMVARTDFSDTEWSVYIEGGELYADMFDDNPTLIRREKSTVAIATNTKYFVTVNWTGITDASEIEIYVNNVKSNTLVTQGSGSSAIMDWLYTYIGSLNDGDGSATYATATIDEVAIYAYNLTSEDLTNLYTTGNISIEPTTVAEAITALSPSAYWPLDDGSAEAVTDTSGNGYDGYWVGVGADEATQDDMLADGVLGVKPATAATTPTGYMENTAVFALGSADTGDYTLLTWVKGFSGTDFDVFSWATAQIASTKEYRGKLTCNTIGELSWSRAYQTGVDIVNDTAYQTATTSGLGLVADVPYLIALRESQTLTEILVNGSVVISLPRVGMGANDTTYAPREELRIGNETIYSGTAIASSYVHGALWNSNLTDANILSIYNQYSALDKTATMAGTQSGQSGGGSANKTGTLAVTGTIVGYQEDRLLESGEFISQSANIAATYVSPDNYIVSNQIPQGIQMVGVSTGDPLTVRYSTHGITTTPTSDPADTPIAPRLLNAGNYKNEIDIDDVGVVTPSFGQVVLDNSDGGIDSLVDKAFDGGSYKLYYGPKNGKFPDDFTKVVDTVMGKPTFDHKSVKIQLKDKMDFLDVPVIDRSFTGTGDSNGTSIVKGEPKQRVIGRVWGAPVQLMDATKLVYWVASDEMASDNVTSNNNGYSANDYRSTPNNWNDTYATYAYGRVFDGGTQITNGQDYSSEADLFAIEPSAGTVRWYRPSGNKGPIMFRLGSSPAADIRVDVETTTSGSVNWYLNELVGERPEFDISTSSVNVALERGFFVNDNTFTYKDAVKEFMKRDFYFARFDRTGEFKVSQVATPDPSATPLYEFNEANMASVTIEQKVPAWKLYINTGEAVGGQVNTGVDDARKDEFTETPYHTISEYEEPATRSRHKLSGIINVETKSWWNETDISTHSDLAKVFLMEDRVKLTVTVDRGHMNSTTLALDIGDTVSVKMSRYNYDLGKNFIVHGVRHDYGTGRLTFTLWG